MDDFTILPSKIQVSIKTLSDWHVGTGAGISGSTDDLLARDADCFPCVPAKTVNGIWRDALERLALGLDNGNEKGVWSQFVEKVFGNQPAQTGADPTVAPFNSKIKIQPARLPERLREKIKQTADLRLKQALAFTKVGVEIDGDSGMSKPEHLRFVEMGRIGTILHTDCELNLENLDENEQKCASALLILSAKLVERFGGKRRRGAGKCEMKIAEITADDEKKAIEFLKSYSPTPRENDESSARDSSNGNGYSLEKAADLTQADDWQAVEFSLTLKNPISIATATLGNVTESLDFVPGTYLLPHLTAKLGKQIFSAIAYGDVQISPATIELKEKNGGEIMTKRGLFAPKALAKIKGAEFEKGKVFNRFAELLPPKKQSPNVRTGFVSHLGDDAGKLPLYENAKKALLMHNTVQDDVQRPTTDVGGVFSREAIPAGTVLRGEIRWNAKRVSNFDFSKLNGEVRIGTSKKDDYGLADLKIPGEAKPFQTESVLNDNKLAVYLKSDVLLRNSNLRQTNLVDDLAEVLSEKLGVALEEITHSDEGLQSSLVQVRRIESWQEKWGRPRPTLTAMQAGSCVLFEVTGGAKPDLTKLQEIEAEGIGERRAEGYGQILFNPKILTEPIGSWENAAKLAKDGNNNSKDNIILSGDEKTFAEFVEKTAWREELKVAALKIADNREKRIEILGFDSKTEKPPMSQIGGLRSAISRLQVQADKGIVTNWLTHLEETSNRLDNWDKNKNKAREKIEKIKNLINDENKVWLILCETKIDEVNVWKTPEKLSQEPEALRREMWAEAVRGLFDAAARAHKRELEKPKKETEENGAQN